jgi:hypothetical protein
MSVLAQKDFVEAEVVDPRWKDLYRLGGISSILVAAVIVLAIVAFFIWPYKPGFTSVENIFITLQNDRLGGLISLDLSTIIAPLISILQILALYAALKRVNESYALIALVFGLMGVVLWLTARPLAEVVSLSNQYAAAPNDIAKSQYLAAGEALIALFGGTAWMVSQVLLNISSALSSLLMLWSRIFSKATAYLGIVVSIVGIGIFIPGLGIVLGLLATAGGMVWLILVGQRLLQLARLSHNAAVISLPARVAK